MKILPHLLAIVLLLPLVTQAAPDDDTDGARLAASVAGTQRDPANRARDPARHPFETLRFFGLAPGQTVVEATSGNTGIGLAMVCAQKGYPLVVTMADSFSIERRKLMRIFGAKVVLTPRAQKGFGMYQKAVELKPEWEAPKKELARFTVERR